MNPSEKILIVDDDPTNVKLLAAKLDGSEYTILKAYSGREGLEKTKSENPDLVLLDVVMPDMSGLEVTAQIKNCNATADIPILLVTALDGASNKAKGLEAGADDFLNKPVHTAELKARIKTLMRMKQYSDQLKARSHAEEVAFTSGAGNSVTSGLRLPHLLIVEDSQTDAKLIKSLLANQACCITVVRSGEEALSVCNSQKIDIMILDILLPGLDGYAVVKEIKTRAATQSIQVIAVTSLQDIESKIKGYEFGVDDYLSKPISFGEFRARVNGLIKKKAHHDELMGSIGNSVQAAATDTLTGARTNEYFYHNLKNELKRAKRYRHSVSILKLDIDNLQQVNERHGRLAGDQALKELAAKMSQVIREVDVLARSGSDEFAIILPYAQKDNAAAVAERIRQMVENHRVVIHEQVALSLSVSIGVAEYAPDVDTINDVIQQADQALHTAKHSGKNRVCSAAGPPKGHPAMN